MTPSAPEKYGTFAARLGGGLLVAMEELPRSPRRGIISALTVGADGAVSEPRPVITEAHHLSYPCLVERGGELFCIPEAAESGRVTAYAVGGAGGAWPEAGRLIEGRLLDPTVFRHEGRWWMFACTRSGPTEARLMAFHADDLFGPWTPHALNPLKSDIRSSRPAGPLFEHGGSLYRPAQDCSRTYGGSVRLMRVERLSPSEFREVEASHLHPGPSWALPHGLHTVGCVGDVVVLDAKRRYLSPRLWP